MLRLVLIGFMLLISIAGCSRSAPDAALYTGQTGVGPAAVLPAVELQSSDEFPAPGDLGKEASSFQKLLGSQVYKTRSAWLDHTTLVLQAPLLPEEGGGDKGESPPKGPSASQSQFAYGIFLFGGVQLDLATLQISTGYNFKTRFWVGLADWDRNAWDFSFGSFFANPTLDISDKEEFDPYIDDAGRIAVAIVADDPDELIKIHSLELTLLSEVTELSTNNYRWDGVEILWDAPGSTDGFRVLRRVAGDTTGPWALATSEPLTKYDRSFVDTHAEPGLEYTFLVQSGFKRSPGGTPRWYWSPGASINGHRQVSEVDVNTGEFGQHIPFLVGNKLGFFSQQALDLSRMDGIRNLNYTPGTDWAAVEPGDSGFTPLQLYAAGGFPLPLLTHQAEQVNNPVCSLIYSTLDGTFSQVCDQQPDDSLQWRTPVRVRESGTVIVALVNMPRRIGAVVFNQDNNMLELVDSVDINGRLWYDFEPGTYPWMIIGQYRPDGKVSVDEHEVDPRLCFRQTGSGEMKFLEFTYDGWIDTSPEGVMCAPGPMMARSSAPLALPETIVFYITPDRSEIRLIRRDIYGTWHPADTEPVVAAGEGGQVTDLVLFTSGNVSFESYMVYNIDGVLYAMRCISTSFKNWTPPVVLDDSGTCRDLRLIKVGSNSNWESHHYASYITDTPEGGKRISFRDLYQATKDQ